MRIQVFLLFFIVGATLVEVHARPAEDDNTEVTSTANDPCMESGNHDDGTENNAKDHEGNAPPQSTGIHVVLRSIRPNRKFDSAFLKQEDSGSDEGSDEQGCVVLIALQDFIAGLQQLTRAPSQFVREILDFLRLFGL